jgi:5-methylcytosine-specific restriction endonuclease McrA
MVCANCGASVPGRGPSRSIRKKYCSLRCAARAPRPGRRCRRSGTCLGCLESFTRKAHSRDALKFCSRACSEMPKGREIRPLKLCAGGCMTFVLTWRKYCGDSCNRKVSYQRDYVAKKPKKVRRCRECGRSFVPAWADKRRTYCGEKCGRRANRRISRAARRAQARQLPRESFDPREIYVRDKWRCGLCRGRIGRRTVPGSPNGPTLDHIVPLAEGGHHTRANVQIAHGRCNARKRTKACGSQLRLLG